MKPDALSRRDVLAMAAGLTIVHPLLAAQREATPEQIRGPFYPAVRPLDHDADLTVMKGKRGRARGQVIHLTGRVVDVHGQPVRGARVELWQANTHGRYAHPGDNNRAPLDPNFQGFGVQITDAAGRYRFKTIKPGPYDRRPPHIHFDVRGRKDRLVTQMYFPGEPLNEADPIFRSLGASRDAAIAKVLPAGRDLEPESLLVQWDIVLVKG